MQPLRYLNDGDRAAFSALYQQHADTLLTHLRVNARSLEDAEDLLLDVFVAALEWESLRACSLDEQRAWLWRVARNKLIDYSGQKIAKSEKFFPFQHAILIK